MVAHAHGVHIDHDIGQITAIVRECIDRNRQLILGSPDISDEDIEQDVLTTLRVQWHRFDPAKSKLSTWVNTLTRRKMIDLCRRRMALERRIHGYASVVCQTVDPQPEKAKSDDADVTTWLERVYKAARKQLPREFAQQGRARYSPAMMFACAGLMMRLNLTWRGAADLFASHPGMCKVVDMRPPRSREFFGRCLKFVSDNPHLKEILVQAVDAER